MKNTADDTHLIIPFFIPHAGCPHSCSYCNQHLTTGTALALPGQEQIIDKVHQWVKNAGERFTEVAFFGGSFTMLPEVQQQSLLEAVQPLLARKLVHGIRISTRPDALESARLAFLSAYQVTTIEIGVQSLSDDVLQLAERGHTASDSCQAVTRVARAGFNTVAQLLPGLPGDTIELTLDSLKTVIDAGAGFVRIYPALVLAGTKLAKQYRDADWQPLTLDEAVSWSAKMLILANRAKVPVIRMGLQSDEHLVVGKTVLAGPWHPAFGQLVSSELYFRLAKQLADRVGGTGQLFCNPARMADVTGHKRNNVVRWQQLGFDFKIRPQAVLAKEQLALLTDKGSVTGSIFSDLEI